MCNSSAGQPHNVNERVSKRKRKRTREREAEAEAAGRNGDKLHEITNYALSNRMPYK